MSRCRKPSNGANVSLLNGNPNAPQAPCSPHAAWSTTHSAESTHSKLAKRTQSRSGRAAYSFAAPVRLHSSHTCRHKPQGGQGGGAGIRCTCHDE
eukprot:6197674-Pleurochrysis_carterae.AAC.1